jgi:hypothetical protein
MMLFTVAEAAALYGTPTGTIRRWICEDGIQGQRDPRLFGQRGQRKLYPASALQIAYDRRHPEVDIY